MNTLFYTFSCLNFDSIKSFHKINVGMPNTVDHDQTVVWPRSAQFAYTILLEKIVYKILGQLSYTLKKKNQSALGTVQPAPFREIIFTLVLIQTHLSKLYGHKSNCF